jgi:uncharacterized protein YecT (DUF1311 family)
VAHSSRIIKGVGVSQRSSSRRVCALITGIVFVLLATIGVLAPPVGAAASREPVLFSVVAHDALPKGITSCPNGSEIGALDCTALKLGAIDRHLDATAAQILLADKREETGPGAQLTNAAATADLNAAERTWLAFRNADCKAWSDHNAGGTIVSLDIVQCALMDGKTRLAELQRQLRAASA